MKYSCFNDGQFPSTAVPNRADALDLLRLFAILAVFAFHFGAVGPPVLAKSAVPNMGYFAKYGYLGVQLFFVISGYVIALSIGQRSALQFSAARVARIYPGYLICMTITALITVAVGGPAFAASFGQWIANLTLVAPVFGSRYIDSAYWSLVIELKFYFWMAALIALGLFRSSLINVLALWLIVSVLNTSMLHSEALRQLLITDHSAFFIAGVLIVHLKASRTKAAAIALLSLAAFCAAYQGVFNAQLLNKQQFLDINEVVAATICVLSILVVFIAVELGRLPISSNIVIAIGGLTYPFYLLHQYVGYIVFGEIQVIASLNISLLLVLTIMLCGSYLVWRYIERPIQKLFRSAPRHSSPASSVDLEHALQFGKSLERPSAKLY